MNNINNYLNFGNNIEKLVLDEINLVEDINNYDNFKLFELINNLKIEFIYRTIKTVGKDDRDFTYGFITFKNKISKYFSELIGELVKERLHSEVDIYFYKTEDELLENIDPKPDDYYMNSSTGLVKNEKLEFEIKDKIKLKLIEKYNGIIHFNTDLKTI